MPDIKDLVRMITRKNQTNNPFIIAEAFGIIVLFEDLFEIMGYFNIYKQIKMIHINHSLTECEQTFVCAHELGHALKHPKLNTPFLMRNTLFSISKIEREANLFAVELLLPDDLLRQYKELSLYTLAAQVGIPSKLADLKKTEK